MSLNDAPGAPVLAGVYGRVGEIVLNRPQALNALSVDMVARLHVILEDWADDDRVQSIVIRGAGARGLCAGADIKYLAQASAVDRHAFFASEYELDLAIANSEKPIVAFMNGITMGAGVGISAHSAFPVVTEQSRVAMPEVRIGLIPDVGTNWILSRAPSRIGYLLAYTAGEFSGADAVAIGFARHFVPSDYLDHIAEYLSDGVGTGEEAFATTKSIIQGISVEPPESPLLARRETIEQAFADPDPEVVIDRLRAAGDDDSLQAAAAIEAASPWPVSVARHSLDRAADQSLPEVFATDLRVCTALTARPDFREGVRAQVIDKDRHPVWNPASLAEVTAESVAAFVS